MKRSTLISLLCSFVLLHFVFGCSSESGVPETEKKAKMAMAERESPDIYDSLQEYPGLEHFFTYGNLTLAEYEDRLFGKFLADDSNADVIASLMDLLPSLIDTGTTINVQMFSPNVQAEMKGKGPIPDLMSAVGNLIDNIVKVDSDKIAPFYDYLDKLDDMENNAPDEPEYANYLLNIITKVIKYLSMIDKDSVNLFMTLAIKDYMECKIPVDGKLDFADFEELLEKFAVQSPEGLSKILQGVKALYYDEAFKESTAQLLYAIGNFMGDKDTNKILKEWLLNLYEQYSEKKLGMLIDGIWDEGQLIGPEVEKMGIEGYGKDGRTRLAIRELLMNPNLLNSFLETIYLFKQEGYDFDRVDEQIIRMVKTDPFCFDLKGEGEYGNGQFYEPNDHFSYKNFSWVKGMVTLMARMNTPLTFTANYLYEADGALESKKYVRSLIPDADKMSFMPFLWSPVYEKGEGYALGHGRPVTDKTGYGMKLNGVYVAPICPALLTGVSMCAYAMGESMVNGPYDNIYDNTRWFFCQRKIYYVMDLVQFVEYVPMLKFTMSPMFKTFGIKTLPVTLLEVDGLTPFIYSEIQTMINNMPGAMTHALINTKLPKWVGAFMVDQIMRYMPVGHPVEGTDKVYLYPQEIRDLWTEIMALAYFDPNAFHLDRFLDRDNPENYTWNYDIREYNYQTNKDTANPMYTMAGAALVAMYQSYREVVEPFPLSMEGVLPRQQAAREAFGGVIYPYDHICNILGAIYENTTEHPVYNTPDDEIMPFLDFAEPIIAMKSNGFVTSYLNLMAILGKPEISQARKVFFEGLKEVLDTIEKDSRSPYTVAAEILECSEKAIEDPRRWDTFKLMLTTYKGVLSDTSEYQIVDDFMAMMNHLTKVEISDEDWALATEGIVEAFGKIYQGRVLTRAAIHMTTILDAFDSVQIWVELLEAMNDAYAPDDGMLSYVLLGMERDPQDTWEEILQDWNRYFHSDTIMKYEEGSFWKDVYYMFDFMAEALE
ncbi:MAG: hypothetical protein KJ737_27535 [Proteobacteria bacterium]|nr:hypothetical protein [Pseudomonadota bacterium]